MFLPPDSTSVVNPTLAPYCACFILSSVMKQDNSSTALPPELQQLRVLLKDDIDQAIARATDGIAQQFETQTLQLDRVEQRIDRVEQRLDGVETQLSDLTATVNRVENKLNATVAQVDEHTTQLRRLNHAS